MNTAISEPPTRRAEPGRIVVYGATGLTGGLTVAALIAAGARPRIAGRSAKKLHDAARSAGIDASDVVVASLSEAREVARLVDDASVVVSCAGPFDRVGEGLVAACALRGAHYVDSTGEANFVRMVSQRYEATALARGCALVPSCAFEVALADCAAQMAASAIAGNVDVRIAYASRKSTPSPGTRASVLSALAHKSLRYEAGVVHDEPIGAEVRAVDFGGDFGVRECISVPSPEVITVPRHVPADRVRVLMAVRRARWIARVGRLVPRVVGTLRKALEASIRASGDHDDASKRAASEFVVGAWATGGSADRTREVMIRGRDPYRVSGETLARAALVLQGDRTGSHVGMVSPVGVLGVQGTLDVLARLGATVESRWISA